MSKCRMCKLVAFKRKYKIWNSTEIFINACADETNVQSSGVAVYLHLIRIMDNYANQRINEKNNFSIIFLTLLNK